MKKKIITNLLVVTITVAVAGCGSYTNNTAFKGKVLDYTYTASESSEVGTQEDFKGKRLDYNFPESITSDGNTLEDFKGKRLSY